MNTRPGGALYSPALLSLAIELAGYPFDPRAELQGEARSRSCGSVVALSANPSLDNMGLKVTACAVGQASAAIFARHARKRSLTDMTTTLQALEAWLAGEGERPAWPDLDMLDAAREYPGRHGAILLPWRAAVAALSNTGTAR